MAHPVPSRPPRSRCSGSGFTLLEMLLVVAMASVLMLIGTPALLNMAARYKIRSSTQQLEMLGHQARYESIKLGQTVTVLPDTYHRMFYVYSGTLVPAFDPTKNTVTDIPPLQRIAVWVVPTGAMFYDPDPDPSAPPPKPPATTRPSRIPIPVALVFSPDGSATGGPVVFGSHDYNQPRFQVAVTSPATGKLRTLPYP
jgi:prepilin-type N-terminal cleavage/methylation domain-containing protein